MGMVVGAVGGDSWRLVRGIYLGKDGLCWGCG